MALLPVLQSCDPDIRAQLKRPPTQTASVASPLCSGDLLSSSGLDSLGLWPVFHESRGSQEQPRCRLRMNAGKVWARCLPCGSLHFLRDGGAERVTIACKARFTLVSPFCSRASGDVILVPCLTWLQSLFPSQRAAPSKPMVSTDQPPSSPV